MKVAIWAFSNPKNFLIHVHGMFHVIKQMGLDTKFQEAADAVENLKIDLDITKDTHSTAKKDHKKKKDKDPPHTAVVVAKTALDKVQGIREAAGTKTEAIGTTIFQLYANLLSDESHQP